MLKTGKVNICEEKPSSMEGELAMFPHAAYLAEFTYLKLKYSAIIEAEDEKDSFDAGLAVYENPDFTLKFSVLRKDV